MDSVIDRAYRGVRFLIDGVIANGAAFALLTATVFALVEIVRRYLFGIVYDWGQDAVTYVIVAAVFLFFSSTQARRSHLAMSAVVDFLRSRGNVRIALACRTVTSVVSLSLFVSLAWWGLPTVERTAAMGRTTQSQVLELWPYQACLVVGFGLMALTTLFQLYQDVQEIRGRMVFTWAPVEEGINI